MNTSTNPMQQGGMGKTPSMGLFVPLTVRGSFALVPLTRGFYAKIDIADWPIVAPFRWHATSDKNKSIYASREVKKGGRRHILMHRAIISPAADRWTDHRNRDSLDNRRCNLRECTPTQNIANKPSLVRDLKGITFHRRANKWMAQITVDGHNHYLGIFATKEDAAKAYERASIEIHGEFAYASSGR